MLRLWHTVQRDPPQIVLVPSLQAALNLLPEQQVAWLRARRQLLDQLSCIWQQKRSISSEIQVSHASKATNCISALATACHHGVAEAVIIISICAYRYSLAEPVSCCWSACQQVHHSAWGANLPDSGGIDGAHAP